MTENTETTVPTESVSTSASAIPAVEEQGNRFERESVWNVDAPEIPVQPEEKTEDVETQKDDKSPEPVSETEAIIDEIFSDDELKTVGKDEIVAGEPSRRTKAAAKQNYDLAMIVRDFQSSEKPLEAFTASLEKLNPQRFQAFKTETAENYVDSIPEAAFKRAFAVEAHRQNPNLDWNSLEIPSLADIVKNGVNKEPLAASDSENANILNKLTDGFDFDWRDSQMDEFLDEETLSKVHLARAYETEQKRLAERGQTTSDENERLRRQIAEQQKSESEKAHNDYVADFETNMKSSTTDFRANISKQLLPKIAKFNGLAADPNDTPEIQAFKQIQMEMFEGTAYEQANNEYSQFENYAYNESSYKGELTEILNRLIPAMEDAAKAQIKKDEKSLSAAQERIEAEQMPMAKALAEAAREFSEKRIKPVMNAFASLSGGILQKHQEAAQRVEITGGGGQPSINPAPQTEQPKPAFETESAWDAALAEKTRELRLRASS